MSTFLAQTYNYTTSTDSGHGMLAGLFSGTFLLVWLAIAIVIVVGMWKMFEKAGRPGWNAIIPLYNYWVLCEIVGKPGWWSLVFLVSWVPVLGAIAVIAVSIIISIELAKSYGKELAYAALLILLPVIGFPMLGFGDAKYVGPGGKPGSASTPPATA